MSKEQNHFIAGSGDMALGAWGLQKVIEPFSLFHSLFTYDIPPRKWISYVNGAEEDITTSTLNTSVNGSLNIETGGVSGNITYLSSRRHPQYQANRGHVYSSSIRIVNPSDNAVQDFGLFTEENGVFFRVNVDGKLYACIQSDGVLVHEDLITMPFDLDLSKFNVFDVQYQWRGAGNYRFFAGNPKTGRIDVIHEIINLNTLTATSIKNPNLSAGYRVTSIGDVGTMQSGCVDVTTEGGRDGREQYVSAFVDSRSINGTDLPALIVRSPALINGEKNTRDSRLVRISAYSDKKTTFKVYFTRDATAITGASFAVAGVGTYLEQDVSATAFDKAKANFIKIFEVQANTGEKIDNPDDSRIDFHLVHGDYLAILATCASAVIKADFEFGEEV